MVTFNYFPNLPHSRAQGMLTHGVCVGTVWALRIRKIHALEAVGLAGDERQKSVQDAAAEGRGDSARGGKLSLAFAARACFAVIKV